VLCAAGEGEIGPVAEDEPQEPRGSESAIPSGSGERPDLGAGSLGGACRTSLGQSIIQKCRRRRRLLARPTEAGAET
jgi:hypothetical protein